MKRTAILSLLLTNSLFTFAQDAPSISAQRSTPRPIGYVDVISECHAAGDGVTDDWAAVQRCINEHPGKRIMFPKTREKACELGEGGGCRGSVDYYVSRTLLLKGNGQELVGEVSSRWPAGPVQIAFSPHLSGPAIWIPSSVSTGRISNLFLNGQRCWNSLDLSTYDPPLSGTSRNPLSGTGADGVLVTGGEATIDSVTAYCFERHGFAVLGDSNEGEVKAGQPDFWKIVDSMAFGNRGFGTYITGADSNAGTSIDLKTTGNELGGIFDDSLLGNTHISPASHMDNRNPLKSGEALKIELVTVSNNVCKLVSSSPLPPGFPENALWISVAGTSGGQSFDGTFKVISADRSGRSLSYSCPSSGGPARGGFLTVASSENVYESFRKAGIKMGAYLGKVGPNSSDTVWINPYCESNSNAPNFGTSAIVIGRGCESNVSGDRTWTSWIAGPGWGSTIRSGQGIAFDNESDTMNWLTIRAGRTAEQIKGIRFSGIKKKSSWDIGQNADSYFFVRDNQANGFFTIQLNEGGATDISAPRNNPVRLGQNSAGGVRFFGGKSEVASVDQSGKGTFDGGVCLSESVCWSSGKGAPSKETCTKEKGGSLYTRTDGGAASSLYICDPSKGEWLPK